MKRYFAAAALALTLTAGVTALAHGPGHKKATETKVVKTVEIAVTENGFEPANATVKKGEPVKIIITRKTDDTCAKEIVLADFKVRKALPLNKPVTVEIVPTKEGEIRYACGMDMVSGVLTVQ